MHPSDNNNCLVLTWHFIKSAKVDTKCANAHTHTHIYIYYIGLYA